MINAKMEIYEGVLGDLPPPATQRFPKEGLEMQLLFMASCADTSAKYEHRFMVKNELFGSKMQGWT
jgi:hypothetical protein